MEKLNHLLSIIHDSELLGLNLQFKDSKSIVELSFRKNENSFTILLKDVKQMKIIDDKFQQEYIGQLKGIKDAKNNFWLSLDPYDERTAEIEELDNYVFCFTDFEIR